MSDNYVIYTERMKWLSEQVHWGGGGLIGFFWWMRIFNPYDHSKLLQRGNY